MELRGKELTYKVPASCYAGLNYAALHQDKEI